MGLALDLVPTCPRRRPLSLTRVEVCTEDVAATDSPRAWSRCPTRGFTQALGDGGAQCSIVGHSGYCSRGFDFGPNRPTASLPDARAMLATAGRRRGRACTALACAERGCQGIAGRQYSLWWLARFRRKRHRGWSLVPSWHRLGALLAGALSTREAPLWDTVLGCAWCKWAGMQRVHGLVFPDRSELIEHLWHNDRVCLCTGSLPVKRWSPPRSSL